MLDFVLVPVDGSEPAATALDYALEIAATHGATIQLLYVADTNKPSLTQYGGSVVDVLERDGEDVLADARERATSQAVPVTDDIVQGDPREAIVDAAAPDLVDLVVLGTHGRDSLEKYVLGSVTEHVVNACEIPVLAARTGEDASQPHPYDDVLVPTDGSETARQALEVAAEIATYYGATLHLLSIVDEPALGVAVGSSSVREQLKADARERVADDASIVRQAGVDEVETTVETGAVPETVRSVATDVDADLIAMGTHGRTGLDDRFLGSTTERVLRTAPVPVLTVGVAGD
ncbi:universal stress protein [Halopiger goleimassiliensis]|uniref:universal stress protein n=1 Tax=Halopiger goleimassiliensis TaxID=1293048 RepID=UPI00067827E1|nr:universal stress protein [Halopiger goleimassiliensis]